VTVRALLREFPDPILLLCNLPNPANTNGNIQSPATTVVVVI
jgi:hypothetical protein